MTRHDIIKLIDSIDDVVLVSSWKIHEVIRKVRGIVNEIGRAK